VNSPQDVGCMCVSVWSSCRGVALLLLLLGPQDSWVGGGGGVGAWQLLKTLAVWLVVNFDSILVAVRILNFVLGEIVIAVENYEQ